MSIAFPASPTVSDRYVFNGRTWMWTGSGWQRDNSAGLGGGFTAPRVYIYTANERPHTYTTYTYV